MAELSLKAIFTEIIRKVGGKWEVKSKDGKKRLGAHATKAGALNQLKAIEAAKHKEEK